MVPIKGIAAAALDTDLLTSLPIGSTLIHASVSGGLLAGPQRPVTAYLRLVRGDLGPSGRLLDSGWISNAVFANFGLTWDGFEPILKEIHAVSLRISPRNGLGFTFSGRVVYFQ